ncbi:MAG: serine/threonine protein kinase [Planctomycetes bacterium]|nr:serine/threonine protein kinase [Planctomycetota bacterium]MBI3834144.1 serine/threonine protein kinase [Planctomycetota bacterium]
MQEGGNTPDDAARRTQVRALVEAARSQATNLSQPGDYAPAKALDDPNFLPGYSITEIIHRGGQGVVYRARQHSTGRSVAVKIMREGPFGGPRDRARFEREVQILGQLSHPNIVSILDSGTASGNSYFIMDHILGVPLDRYVQDGQVPIASGDSADSVIRSAGRNAQSFIGETLRLFVKICDAMHAAHLHGIIHRDLKPSNILIDANGEPHILDFGLAKFDAVGGEASIAAGVTTTGHFVGSLPWASPEQAAGDSRRIDIRTDVYSLGVILYQALVGRFPYSVTCSIRDALDRIIHTEPARPSSVARGLNHELDTIVLKCLAKDPKRRYQSAAELGADIRRFLTDEPIVARPASRTYQMRKFAKRNKALVGGVFAVFVVLVIGLVGISWALIRAKDAGRAALMSAAKAKAVNDFLQNMLAGVDPESIGPNALTVREVLDHASARLEKELVDQPEVAASIHQTLGKHYSTLGHFIEADQHHRKAVELRRSLARGNDPELAEALFYLAANLQEKRDIVEAEAPTREALEMRRRLFGQESLQVADSLYDLASILIDEQRPTEAEPLARESLAIRRRLLGAQHASVATSVGMLGWCLMALGRLDEAEAALRDAVEMVRALPGDNERALAARLTYLSNLLRTREKYVEQEAVLREAIDIRTRRLAQNHPALAWNLLNLAQIRRRFGDLDEAEAACRKALEIYEKKRGPRHGDVADCQQLLAQIYEDQGRLVEAQAWWSACLEMRRQLLPPGHPDIAFAESALARNGAAQEEIFTPLHVVRP